jgi:hypothetical protein
VLSECSRTDSSTIAIKTDFANAFNSASRGKIWHTLLQHSATEPIWKMFHWSYSTPSPLLVYDSDHLCATLSSQQGVRQGDPFASFAFALFVQPLYERAIADLPKTVHAISIHDDLTLIGPQQHVMTAFDRLANMAQHEFGLTLRRDKCAVYVPNDESDGDGEAAEATAATAAAATVQHATIEQACAVRQLPIVRSLPLLGMLVGSDAAVAEFCSSAVDAHAPFFAALVHPTMPLQVGYLLLRHCALPRLSFLARTMQPRHFHSAAARFDEKVLRCFETMMGLSSRTMEHNQQAHHLPRHQITSQIQLPVSMGGMGLRPTSLVSHAAYFSSLAHILPDFLSAFPPRDNYSDAQIHAELTYCREELFRRGATNAADDSSSPSPSSSAATTPAAAARAGAKPQQQQQQQQSSRKRGTPPAGYSMNPYTGVLLPTGSKKNQARSSAPTTPALRINEPSSSPFTLHHTIDHMFQQAMTYAVRQSTVPKAATKKAAAAAALASSLPVSSSSSAHSASSSSRPPAPSVHAPTTYLHPHQLQHALTTRLEKQIYKQLYAASDDYHKAVLTALSTPNCSPFLSLLPTQPCYTLTDAAMRLAVRHRLGLLPFDALALPSSSRCNCAAAPSFLSDPDHFHSCSHFKRTFQTQRHNNVMQVLMDLARSVGFYTIQEPNNHIRPDEVAQQPALSQQYNQHADILLLKHDQKLYIDVSITRPTNASNLSRSATLTTQLVSTRAREREKMNKYSAIADVNGYELIPFVMETYGGLGHAAAALLRRLAQHSREYSPNEFIRHAYARLSVCLQASNANLALLSMQQLATSLHLAHKQMYKTRYGYAQPQDSNRLAEKVEGKIRQYKATMEDDDDDDDEQQEEQKAASAVAAAATAMSLSPFSSSSSSSSSSSPSHLSATISAAAARATRSMQALAAGHFDHTAMMYKADSCTATRWD